MPVISAIFLVLSLVLAVLIGPQTRPWTWGPAMLALGISTVAAAPVFWRKDRYPADFGLLAFGLLVAGWFAWRAWISPVAELGQTDLMLLAGAVGAFVSIRAIQDHPLAERIVIWGVALLLLANVVVLGKQVFDPSFSPLFRSRASSFPSGFYAHYNEAANYLIASSMIVGGAALVGRHHAMPTRILWILIALAGLAGVWVTRSRGGIFGAAIACGVLAVFLLVVGKRRNARWFAPALIALPLVGFGIAAFLYMGWQEAQEIRQSGGGAGELFDNNARLSLLGIALSCIGLHPLSGGGSQSFSWECRRFIDLGSQGRLATLQPELVHNELVQSATDYGLVGAGLLIGLLVALALVAVLKLIFGRDSGEFDSGDGWRLGALAGLAGMLVQSSFSFVFHLFPGVLLLGICLGQMSRSSKADGGRHFVVGSKIVLALASVACAVILLPFGWKGTIVTRCLWSTYFDKVRTVSAESKTDALSEAIAVWPQSGFYQDRAAVYHAASSPDGGKESEEAVEKAVRDYSKAADLQAYDPEIFVNLANLLSRQQREREAEAAYDRAIQIQGGMEPAFKARYYLANHLMHKGVRLFNREDPSLALAAFEVAAQQMEQSVRELGWAAPNLADVRVTVHESLGAAREANGDYPGALAAYDFATTLTRGSRANYRAGVLFGKQAASAWMNRRSAEALGLFIEAKRRIDLPSELPRDVSPSQRLEYLAYLDRTIAYFKGANIEPLPFKK